MTEQTQETQTVTTPHCPNCSSAKVWRDGTRQSVFRDSIQRWLCRDCGLRFSYPETVNNPWGKAEEITRKREKSIRTDSGELVSRQIGVEETKNLATATETKTVAGEGEKSPQKKSGHRFERKPVDPDVYALSEVLRGWLRKEGYRESPYPDYLVTLSRWGADLQDPESVKMKIAERNVKEGTKLKYVYAYDALMKMSNTTWTLPKYKQEESIPFVPDESELLQLIAGAHSRKLAAYLQLLKDTWPDPTEALRLEYGEVNGNIVSINHPVKDHMCRQIEVSDECVAMLNSLGVQSGRYFKMTYKAVYGSFKRLREKVAKNRGDPRFLQITLNSFRHWGGTMLAYYSNGNVLHVKKNLGHRRVENTMKYIDMAKALRKKSCEFESVSVTSAEEILAMGKSGWEKYDEAIFQGITYHFYKRPKRFGYADYKVGSETLNFYKQ